MRHMHRVSCFGFEAPHVHPNRPDFAQKTGKLPLAKKPNAKQRNSAHGSRQKAQALKGIQTKPKKKTRPLCDLTASIQQPKNDCDQRLLLV